MERRVKTTIEIEERLGGGPRFPFRRYGLGGVVVAVVALVVGAVLLFALLDDDDGPKSFAEGCSKSDATQFSGPDQLIDETKSYVATIKTAKGDIVLELFSDVPITTNNFVFLACKGFYDGVTFHRVLPGFVAQGGDPTGTGSGGPGYAIPDEPDGDHTFEAGVVSMAKGGPDTTGSQFFITYTPQPGLETDFTVFGRVTSGMDVVDQLTPRNPDDVPTPPPGDIIETITIAES